MKTLPPNVRSPGTLRMSSLISVSSIENWGGDSSGVGSLCSLASSRNFFRDSPTGEPEAELDDKGRREWLRGRRRLAALRRRGMDLSPGAEVAPLCFLVVRAEGSIPVRSCVGLLAGSWLRCEEAGADTNEGKLSRKITDNIRRFLRLSMDRKSPNFIGQNQANSSQFDHFPTAAEAKRNCQC